MKLEESDFVECARHIHDEKFAGDSLEIVKEIAAERCLPALVDRLMACERSDSISEEKAVENAMRHLEAMAVVSQPYACMAMVHLSLHAAGLYMHHVCDAVDLWVYHTRFPELIAYLQWLASIEEDEDMKEYYEGWVHELTK